MVVQGQTLSRVFLWRLVEEQLLRSVEGQAASDEEEEKWTGEQRRQIGEVKRILSRLSCCGERYCPLGTPAVPSQQPGMLVSAVPAGVTARPSRG
ncbi:unnamed protein product [Tetraodon nigroviridis]|uniref:(spotted green pufferfish) hypothetical protein n=1 Tax=Tetraodon nigroviridis TaxID=99883 RepID=Q4SQW4_TETNG|nr:unnamed protein product [Tetraodon nigroviridis]